MTPVIRAVGSADFLALVPVLLGFRPSRSLVLVPFGDRRALGAMRVDLPDTDNPSEIERIAFTFIGFVCRVSHANAVAAVVYPDAPHDPPGGAPQRPLVEALVSRARLCGLAVRDALWVADDAWGCYLDPDEPSGGRPLAAIPYDHDALRDLPVRSGDQSSGVDVAPADPEDRERVAHALDQIEQAFAVILRMSEGSSAPEAADRLDPRAWAAAGRLLDDLPLLYEDALSWDADALDSFEIAMLAWCLASPATRDVALLQWVGTLHDGTAAALAQRAWTDGAAYSVEVAAPMWDEGARPDAARLGRALAVARGVAAAVPDLLRAGALATCAWLAWARGNSSHAGPYARAALDHDPEHVLALTVMSFIDHAHLPAWTFERTRTDAPVTHTIDSGAAIGRAT